ncbi:MAG: hypothetical protein KKE17_08380 [Proteobacteria bacterium]|nr:hypothetical protein [Pseudomonadota bacterium]MBU1710004.1 hypothetical protein [Pseudomonadota bacterium]
MGSNISDIMTIQIKKEIADRYFGFRKIIEQDKIDLEQQIRQHSFILEKRISFDLIRLYILLLDEKLIHAFFSIIGLEQKLFYDPSLTESSAFEKRVFEGVRFRGFTQAGRFENFIYDCYERLDAHVELYRQHIEELQTYQETIAEEIRLFYKQNDLCAILGFLRQLGTPAASSVIEGGMEVGMAAALEQKMRIDLPLPVEQFLPLIPSLKPFAEIKPALTKIIRAAYSLHGIEFKNIFSHRQAPSIQGPR